MPYSGISDPATIAKLDDCVTKVMATGKDKSSAIAICRASMNKELKEDDSMSRQDRAKAKKRRASKQAATITDLSELGQAFGWSEKDVKASYPWDSCIADQMKKYGSRTRAEKICGAIRANAGKALSDERIATLISLSPVTAPNFRAAIAEKGITDAPNLRVEDAQCCGNCQYYKELASGDNGMGMMQPEPPDDSGICTKYDFEADSEWVCDAWEAVATPDVAGAIQDAAQAIADTADGMGAMGKEAESREKFNPNHDSSNGQFASGGGSGGKRQVATHGDYNIFAEPHPFEAGKTNYIARHVTGTVVPVSGNSIDEVKRNLDTHYSHKPIPPGFTQPRTPEQIARAAETARQIAARRTGKEASPLTLFKQADGRLRVVGWASNNRRDKDNPPEIITEAAHKEFMAYLDAHPEHAPEFWHWHTLGTKYAKADWWDYADGFTVYSGLVDAGKEAQAEKAASEGIGMSHGFHVLGYDNANHHITQYRTFEVSDLPKSRAANPYTSFSTIRKEASMAFSEAKKAYLLERLPAETVAELERKTSDLKAAADAAGIEAKEVVDTPAEVAAEVAAPVDEKADSKPTDNPAEVAADGGNAKPKTDTSNADMMQMMSDMIDKKLAAMGKEVNAAVLTVAEAVKGINERVATVEETAAKAEEVAKQAVVVNAKSLDEIVAEMISPTPLRKGYRASAAADTRVPAKKQDSIETPAVSVVTVEEPTLPGSPSDWWTKEVMKPAGLA